MSQTKSSKPYPPWRVAEISALPREQPEIYKVYTDGACRGNGKDRSAGGYAAVWQENESWHKISSGEPNITNQQAELKAALLFLDEVSNLKNPGFKVEIYTDSAYLYRCWVEGWWKRWQKNGWKNSSRMSVSNRDLWERLIPYFKQGWLTFYHVKGHIGIEGNEIADTEACYQADKIKEEMDNGNI